MKNCVLFLFNSSTYAVQPWIDAGVHCVSVDFDDTDHSGARHAQESTPEHTRLNIDLAQAGAVETVKGELSRRLLRPALVVSFAPCTDLAVSGSRWFEHKRAHDPLFQEKAAGMARLASRFGVPYMVENPVSVLATLWRKPDFTFHPWEFSSYCPQGPHPEAPELYAPQDRYNKKTCLWTGNGFVHPVKAGMPPETSDNPGWKALGGKSARTKHLRSLTPRGFACAVMAANITHVINYTGEQQ